MTTRQQIAKEHGITTGRVSQLAAQGCPVDDPEAARAWIATNIRRADDTPLDLPPEAAALRVGARARLERATDAERALYALWREAVEAGGATPRTITELHGAWSDSRKAAAQAEKEYHDFVLRLGITVNKAAMTSALRAVLVAIKQDLSSHSWGDAALATINRHFTTAAHPLSQTNNNQQP